MRIAPKAVVLAVVLLVGLVAAPAAVAAQSAEGDAESVVQAYNDNIGDAPDVIANRFADERITMTVEGSDGEATYTAVTDGNAEVVSFEEGENDPTIRVTTDEETISEIAESEDTGAAAVEAYESEDVTVEGVGVTNTVTVETAKLGYEVGSALGLL
jgi:uncharacterized protein with LGFP repeats